MMNLYEKYRPRIKSGDLLAWDYVVPSKLGTIYGYLIQMFTRDRYTHVGIALVEDDRVLIIEAAPPEIQISCLSKFIPFYHIPMDIEWTEEHSRILKSRLGERYSRWEAVKSYFTSPKQDRYWQCAEFIHWYYKQIGLDYKFGYTPKSVISTILQHTGNGIYLINN